MYKSRAETMLCRETIDVEINMMVNMAKTMRVENFTRIHLTVMVAIELTFFHSLQTQFGAQHAAKLKINFCNTLSRVAMRFINALMLVTFVGCCLDTRIFILASRLLAPDWTNPLLQWLLPLSRPSFQQIPWGQATHGMCAIPRASWAM